MAKHLITTKAAREAILKSAASGQQKPLPDSDERGGGRLLLMPRNGKGLWYLRYQTSAGHDRKFSIGAFVDAEAATRQQNGASYSIKQARVKAAELVALRDTVPGKDLHAHFDRMERERVAAEVRATAEREAAEQTRLMADRYTLAAMLLLYCDHLDAQHRISAKGVREALSLHIVRNHPDLAARPARAIERAELASVIRRLTEAGKVRTGGLLRSYLHAAYRLAQNAEGDTSAPAALIAFRIERNPVEGIKSIAVAKRTRNLSTAELRAFLARLASSPSVFASVLRACLWAGGQRPQQVIRATIPDYDRENRTLMLYDGKGRRNEPRPHLLPLQSAGIAEIERRIEIAQLLDSRLLFTSNGTKPVTLSGLSLWLQELCTAMIAAGELSAPFQAKDLRRTIETIFSAMHANEKHVAHLMSHGLTGLQRSRYDMHDHFDEKRALLIRLEAHLQRVGSDEPDAKVVAGNFGRAA